MKSTKKLYVEHVDYAQVSLEAIRSHLEQQTPLEVFAFQEAIPGEQIIRIETAELTCICPFSDQPDFGHVVIEYVPRDKCLELKSYKLYIGAFRDIKIFHEGVTEVILADIVAKVQPRRAEITVEMNPRGNVKTVCRKQYVQKEAK